MGEAEQRVEMLLGHLGDAIRDLLLENRSLRRRLHNRNNSGTGFARIDHRLINLFKASSKPHITTYVADKHLLGHRDGIFEVSSCSFEDNLLASASADGTAVVWSRSSRSASLIVKGHQGSVNSARFHPSKPFLLTASGDTTAAITPLHVSLARRGSDSAVHKSDEDKEVVLSRSRSLPTITQTPGDTLQETLVEPVEDLDDRQASTGLHIHRPRARSNSFPGLSRATVVDKNQVEISGAHTGPVSSAGWVEDGSMVATGSWDCDCLIYDCAQASPVQLRRLVGHEGRITNLSTHRASKMVLTSSLDETFRLWDLRSPTRPTNVYRGHTGAVTSAVFAKRSDDLIASASEDRTVQIWDPRIVKKPLTEIVCSSRVNRLCFSPSGMALTLPADDGSLKTYNLSGDVVSHTPRESYRAILNSAVWSVDESELFSAGWDLAVTSWKPQQDCADQSKDVLT